MQDIPVAEFRRLRHCLRAAARVSLTQRYRNRAQQTSSGAGRAVSWAFHFDVAERMTRRDGTPAADLLEYPRLDAFAARALQARALATPTEALEPADVSAMVWTWAATGALLVPDTATTPLIARAFPMTTYGMRGDTARVFGMLDFWMRGSLYNSRRALSLEYHRGVRLLQWSVERAVAEQAHSIWGHSVEAQLVLHPLAASWHRGTYRGSARGLPPDNFERPKLELASARARQSPRPTPDTGSR